MLKNTNLNLLSEEYKKLDSLSSKKLALIDHIIVDGDSLLDIGIGSGNLIELERKKFNRIIGIDTSDDAILITNKRLNNNSKNSIYLEKTDLKGLTNNYDLIKFDCITCLDVLEHMSLEECKESLEIIFELLATNGIFIFSGPGIFEKFRIRLGLSPTHLHSHSSYGWAKLLKNAGFKIINITCVEYPIVDNIILRKHFHIFGKCCVITAKK